jgi:hypothetical protein
MSIYDALPQSHWTDLARCQCGKVSYASDAEAKRARALVVGRDRAREEIRLKALVVYVCPLSKTYHLGRGFKPVPRQRRKPI